LLNTIALRGFPARFAATAGARATAIADDNIPGAGRFNVTGELGFFS